MSCLLLSSRSATVLRVTPASWISCGFSPKKLPKVERSPCLYVDHATIERKLASFEIVKSGRRQHQFKSNCLELGRRSCNANASFIDR